MKRLGVTSLKTLHMSEPLGIDVKPYFSWVVKSEERNTVQEAYQIVVVDEEKKQVWDSGKVKSDQESFITYCGKSLKSCMKYIWNVEIWDNHGNKASAESFFETALLSKNEWKAQWAESPFKRNKAKKGFGNQEPATHFRRKFALRSKPVKARAYVTAHGIYQLSVNGTRCDGRELAPEHTVYEKYLCYQTYDITEYLTPGSNTLGMYVGDGWYLGAQSLPDIKNMKHAHAVLFQVHVTYEDGSCEVICSDNKVKAAYGAVQCSDLYAGEKYDANQKKSGWDTPAYNDAEWSVCRIGEYGYANLIAQLGNPVRHIMELPAVNVRKSPAGEWIIDFGQVLAGKVRMKINVKAGTQIVLDHCEVLDSKGNFFNNIIGLGGVGMGVDQKDEYISDGEETVYEPLFTFHGFRYVRVTGVGEIKKENFTAIVLSSDGENVGEFYCSDGRLNRLYENTRWSQRANMLSIPTDCPQREKAGWTGDIMIYARTALQNADNTSFLARWLQNVSCDQDERGSVPIVVPCDGPYPMYAKFLNKMDGIFEKGKGTSSGWGDAAIMVPYQMYQITGNTRVLEDQYDSMKKWCDYIITKARTKRNKKLRLPKEIDQYLWNTGFHFGEWLIPSCSKEGYGDKEGMKKTVMGTSKYTAPIFGWNSVHQMSEVAELLGRKEDARHYGEIADKMADAFTRGVIDENGDMPIDMMGAYALPIYFGLVPERFQKKFADKLVKSIVNNNMCLDTGFLGTPFLLDALCKIGRVDMAYKLLWQHKCPSWLYEVDKGATTIWESWYAYKEDGEPMAMSLNHYAFGCIDDWMYRYIGGIRPAEPGYKHVRIEPQPDEIITSANRRFLSEHGWIGCEWAIEKGKWNMTVEIPCNVTATVVLPSGITEEIGSGIYQYSSDK
ncbi:family 78 glycoside hydrolase catalytic domain [Eisenbergiella massiliensis]|uniref:alpha-L-rhamnosidase n=4 Tax=Eisenbergiella TaxID=1432051 RepID=A0A3E3I4P8_9FIRM|nr:family 78 glycoside hydrolase catalytic domain [Eisenbergiella massiliensis]RGE60266.1 alpha-L-rhamnosidase [Eisenbergiella massiliensis]